MFQSWGNSQKAINRNYKLEFCIPFGRAKIKMLCFIYDILENQQREVNQIQQLAETCLNKVNSKQGRNIILSPSRPVFN